MGLVFLALIPLGIAAAGALAAGTGVIAPTET